MTWKYRWLTWSLLKAPPKQVTHNFLFSPSSYFSSVVSLSKAYKHRTHCLSHTNIDASQLHRHVLVLTCNTVHSTLSSCSSDLVALSFFLWCAREPNYFHDKPTFDLMVTVVTRLTERYESVKGIVLALQSVGCVTKAQTFLLLMRIYWCGGMNELVFEAYDQMVTYGYVPNTFARNIVMDILFKTGRTDLAMKILRETEVPNFLTFNTALLHLCKSDGASALHIAKVLGSMLRSSYYPNVVTFEILLHFFCKMGRMRDAYQILGLMVSLGIPLSVSVWTILINGFCRLNRLDIASSLYGTMAKVDCSPNVVTYTTLFKAFMDSNRVADAVGVLNIIVSQGHTPDLFLYNVMIDCYSKKRMYREALDVFTSLKKLNMVPDLYTLSSLLPTICISRKFSLLPKLGHADTVLYNSLLSSLCKAGFPSHAVKSYNNMIRRGFIPDNYTFAGLLSGLCGIGRIGEALDVYHGILMSYPKIDAHIHTIIIDGLIRLGNYHAAITVLRKAIKDNLPLDDVSFMVIIDGLIRGGRVAEAFELHEQMKEYGLPPSIHTYNTILVAFCKKRDIKMVKQMLGQIIAARGKLSDHSYIRLADFFQ